MKKLICLLVLVMVVSGCAELQRIIQSQPQESSQQQQSDQQKDWLQEAQYRHPDLECRKYPPGYPIPMRPGSITYPDGVVCFPKTIRDKSGRIIGTID